MSRSVRGPARTGELILNIAPLTFSSDTFGIGRTPYENSEQYRDLCDRHWNTHAFRYDSRTDEILSVPIVAGVAPVGREEEVAIGDYLLLAGRAVQQAILTWIAGNRLRILKSNKHLMFWGQADEALLLSQAVEKLGLQRQPKVEVALRYDVDCRMFSDREERPYLGLVVNVQTANIIDVPVTQLIQRGMRVENRYVGQRATIEHPFMHPSLELVGRVSQVKGGRLMLSDAEEGGPVEILADHALLEPRVENLHDVIVALWGARAHALLGTLQDLRRPISSADGKLKRINSTIAKLRQRGLRIAGDVRVEIGDLINTSSVYFPEGVPTARPPLLFGPQGRNSDHRPDYGIRTWGPFMYTQHARSTPVIGIVCESQHRGAMDQFAGALQSGYPEELWRSAEQENPYRGGLVGKFRLDKVRFEFEEANDASPAAYRLATQRLLRRLSETPDLVIVQTREEFTQRFGNSNPYLIAKAALMVAGIPMQAISIEKLDVASVSYPYILNTLALASYAKLDGVPWVISSVTPATHELVIGIGSAEASRGRLGPRERYVGITTVFQGDGRYMVWGITREVPFDEYPDALLESLRSAVRHVATQNVWEPGDRVRLIFHVYKRLKDCEVQATKAVARELLDARYEVEFAYLDISTVHPYRMFAPGQLGLRARQGRRKGVGVPERGTCLLLDRRRALLHLAGPHELKTDEQGLPRPLLVELHPDSDLTSLPYLIRQIYHFTFASWQSFNPATEPVTIKYSRMIAKHLANLRAVTGWDSTVVSLGPLRSRRWFL